MKGWVIDTSVLSPFARAGELETLDSLTAGVRRMTTRSVRGEIENGIGLYPDLQVVLDASWLQTVRMDSLPEMIAFSGFTRLLGSEDARNAADASVLAYAKIHDHLALLDDATARQVGLKDGVQVKRSLALIAHSILEGRIASVDAEGLVQRLVAGGARCPHMEHGFLSWAREHRLLPEGS